MRRVMFFVVLMVLFFVYEVRGGLFDGVFTNFFDENGIKLKAGNVNREGLGNLVYDCYYDSGMWLYSVAYGYGSRDKWRNFARKITNEGKKVGNDKSEYTNRVNIEVRMDKIKTNIRTNIVNGATNIVTNIITNYITNHLICQYVTGIDCSGFVQGFWRLYFAERYSNYVDYYGFTTSELGTSGLPGISYRIPVWQITQYDALNKFGDHVVLFDRFDTNSGNFGYSDLTSCYIYESGGGIRVDIDKNKYTNVNPNRGMRYGKPSHPAVRTPFYKTNVTKNYFTNNYSEFIRVLTNDPNNTHLPDIHNTNAMYMYLVGSNDNLADIVIDKTNGNKMSPLDTNYLVYRFGLDDVPPMVEVDVSNESISNWNISIKVKDTQCAGIRVLDTTSKKINVLTNAFRVSLVGVGEIRNVFGITNFVESYNGGPMVYRSYRDGSTVINSEGVRLWRIYNKLHYLQFLL